MKAIVEVNIPDKYIIERYHDTILDNPTISKKHFLFDYILECVYDNGKPTKATYKQGQAILRKVEKYA